MHGFDIGAGAILLAAGVWSFFRGLTREVISILGLIAAVVLGAWGAPRLAAPLEPVIAPLWLRQTMGFAAIFLAVVLAYALLAKIIRRMVNAVGLSLPDRILGSLFGILKAAVLIALLLIALTKYDPDTASRLTAQSQLAPPLFRMAEALTALLPADLYTDFQRFYNRLHQRGERQTAPRIPAATPQSQPSATIKPSPASTPTVLWRTLEQDERSLRQIIQERLQAP